MNKDDILIVKYPFRMTPNRVDILHKSILEQKETGVIILPDYCEVVVIPKDVEIKVEMEET